ncbi:MAG: GTP cyclohydrolase, FolE2/MptA family [Chitinivorax sp.]
MNVRVPVTSLCPCSKQISAYGAHNQRSHISIRAAAREGLSIEALIRIAEQAFVAQTIWPAETAR